ncbi:MAG: hypothetical protein Q7T55_19015, partial [Solirubrobacteraceae bacterium]|nr:hypothetical protein [Solirubrobacteraceae bacterium]
LSQPSTAVSIIATRVSLPDVAATADLLSLLPPALAERYADAGKLRRPPPASPEEAAAPRRRQPKIRLMASRPEYLLLVRRMLERGMLDFTTAPVIVNGLHGVPKGPDGIRLIIDARPANLWFCDPDHVDLPTPDVLARLRTAGKRPFAVSKGDLDNFYHRIRTPPSFWPYFALPPVRAADVGVGGRFGADALVWPCCTTLPMGWSHSVFVAQTAHLHLVLSRTGLRPADRISSFRRPTNPVGEAKADGELMAAPDRRICWDIYIDDLILFGPDAAELAKAHQQWADGATAAGVPPKLSKSVPPTFGPVECIGVEVDGVQHTFGLSATRLQTLVEDTTRLLRLGVSTGWGMRQLIGRWIWACLPVRPSLSVLSSVFTFAMAAGRRLFTLWPSVRIELSTLCGIAPLLVVKLDAGWFRSAIATDASSQGQGVVTARVATPTQLHCAGLAGAVPTHLPLPPTAVALAASHRWSTIVSSQWRFEEHINVLELRAISTAVRWALSQPAALGARLLILSDSTVAVAALAKGRSSSPLLLRRLRQVSAHLLASGLQLAVCWLPSAANPADGPSRVFPPRPGRRW